MKKSEIKDLYNNSETALMAIKAVCLSLPNAKDVDELALKAAAQVSTLYPVVKQMCDYMIDDGGYNMSERLQEIDRELRQIESDVAKMGYSKERYILCRNCRAIINTIKDVDIWGNEPQQKPNEGAGGELADSEPKTLSEPTETTTAGNDDQQGENSDDQYIKLPLGMQTPDERAERIFTAATDEGYMEADEQHGTWIGKGNISNRTHEVVARKRQLAYLCKLVYGDIPPWTAIEEYFNEKGLAHELGNIKNYEYSSTPTWQKALDNLKANTL